MQIYTFSNDFYISNKMIFLHKKNSMKFIYTFIIICLISFFSCQNIKDSSSFFPSENPIERVEWDNQRMSDPATGKIPNNIRKKELTFAKTLTKSN